MKLIYRSIFWSACCIVLLILGASIFIDDKREIAELKGRLMASRNRLNYIELLNQQHELNIKKITSQLKIIHENKLYFNNSRNNNNGPSNNNTNNNVSIPLNFSILQDFPMAYDMALPNFFTYLPHLKSMPHAIQPAFKLSRSRFGVSFVLGVPTIKRDKHSYLIETLTSLITNLVGYDKNDCIIVVSVCEITDQNYINDTITSIEDNFKEALDSGLLEVIVPSPYYYPSLEHLNNQFGDTLERVKWRTKQNLDYSYLMMYARNRGQYYVQLEDDVVTKSGYLNVMRTFVSNHDKHPWLLLEFSHLGFIGKLFKSTDLALITEFFLMFHRDKPVDWLLDNLLFVKVCNPEKNVKECNKAMLELRKRFNPSLFQHVGVFSSLKGKVQKLKDKYFKSNKGGVVHVNPLAEVLTDIKVYQNNGILGAYSGSNNFWGLSPSMGNYVLFNFKKAAHVESFRFESGDVEHPGDKFFNASVEVLPLHNNRNSNNNHNNKIQQSLTSSNNNNTLNNKTLKPQLLKDGYMLIDWFDGVTGRAEGTVPKHLRPITGLRITMHSALQNWVILREISIQETPQTTR